MLLSLLTHLLVAPALIPSPPGWDQYVSLIEHALDFLAKSLHSAALAVVVFTLLIKTALIPLTVQSIRSSKAMQELQPKIKELQKKYGKDRQRLSQEQMKLYNEHRVNPWSGCLPTLLQMPIFWGLYRAIRHLSLGSGIHASGYWQGGFLWIDSLAHKDPYHVLPIFAGVLQFVQTKMMRPAGQEKATDPQQAMMNQMMTFMPLAVVLFGWGFPAGAVIYWVTQSLFSVVQQWFITGWGSMRDWFPRLPELPEHRRLGYRPPRSIEDVVVVSGEEGAAVQPRGVMGWFQRKMEEAQQQAAAGHGTGSQRAGARVHVDKYQARVDDETAAGATARPARPRSASGRAGSRAARAGKANGTRSAAITSASSTSTPETNGGGGPAPAPPPAGAATGPARQPIVPRRSRPPRKDATKE